MDRRMRFTSSLVRIAWVLALALLTGCGGDSAPVRHAVDTHAEDACAVCGMYLDGSPGPRAQAWIEGRTRPLLFDSTRDFFAYVLQPENQAALQELFVQNSAHIDWRNPSHAAVSFIDARSAWYVAWQPLPGSMGPTLAPFATRAAADGFARQHGGAVLRFGDITAALVAALDYHCPTTPGTGPDPSPSCRAGPMASPPAHPDTEGQR